MPLHVIVVEDPSWRRLRANRQRAREIAVLYPGAACRVWYGAALHDEIRAGLGGEVAAAFDRMVPDRDAVALASWCLLHLFGGIVCAPELQALAPLGVPDHAGVAAFNDLRPRASSWAAIDPAILWSRAGRAEWTLAIAMKIEASRQAPSRPAPNEVILGHAFGRVAIEGGGRRADDQWVGQVRPIPGPAGAQQDAFVAPNGTIVALRGPG